MQISRHADRHQRWSIDSEVEERSAQAEETIAPSQTSAPQSPFQNPLFRMLWLATLISNVGTWMQEVANSWLMTTLAPDPLMVSLVQVATTLPMFLLGLPAGALADLVDKRRWLLGTQTWMMLAAAVMAFLTLTGQMTPWLLLLGSFYLSVGAALNSPGWHSVTPEIVPKESLRSAVTANGVVINVARALGPAIGGLVLVKAGPGAAFLLNSISFLAVVFVLYRWKRQPETKNLPSERFLSAMRLGLQHVRHSPLMRLVVLRAGILVFTISVVWALLPLLCKVEYGYGPKGYGLMLVANALGAIFGATVVLPRLRKRLDANQIVSYAWIGYTPTLLILSYATHPIVPFCAMVWGGLCNICMLSSFHLAAQSVAPDWVRARAMAVYLLIFSGATAFGSLFWGFVGRHMELRQCLVMGACFLLMGTVTAFLAPLKTGEEFDHEPSNYWPDPDIKLPIPLQHGPVMVTVEYDIAPEDSANFLAAMERIRRIRYRNGVIRWGMYVELEQPHIYREVYLEESWAAHLRQHERVSTYEMEVAQTAYQYHRGKESPKVYHMGFCDHSFPGKAFEEKQAQSESWEPASGTVPVWFLD